jgi:acetylornithine deacetylase/succinyl-diaminopimelate desuccinylase-like protein
MKTRSAVLAVAMIIGIAAVPPAGAQEDVRRLSRDILRELIEIDTTEATGNTTTAAHLLADRLKQAGLSEQDVLVIGPDERHGNLVARLRGTGARRPILFIAHLDVVGARREDWSVDPFKFLEKDGYYYGRGTSDIKGGVAILVTNLIRLAREKYRPDRDLILALTAGEETGIADGIEWLLKGRRPLIDSIYCVNLDGGDFQLKNGKRRLVAVQASEKLSVMYRLEGTDSGGHSSLPRPDNPIYHLTAGLSRVSAFEFPVNLNEVTRAYLDRMSALETGQTAADMKAVTRTPPEPAAMKRLSESPYLNALLRTTCVATRLEAGHADNALPQKARALINCRLLPGHDPEDVRSTLERVVNDRRISVTGPITQWEMPRERIVAPPARLEPELMRAVESVSGRMWRGVPIVPTMETGGTDGYYLRPAGVPTFGVSGVFLDMDDVRAHGKDERVGVDSFHEGVEFHYRLMKALSSGDKTH